MNYAEMGAVLAKAACFDFRTVGELDVMAWWEAAGDLDPEEALAAVPRWYRDRADRLMPSHLRETVSLLRAERAREARVRDALDRYENGPQDAPAVRFGDLSPEVQEALRTRRSGALRAMVRERFDPHGDEPVNPPNVLDAVYGDGRQGEGETPRDWPRDWTTAGYD